MTAFLVQLTSFKIAALIGFSFKFTSASIFVISRSSANPDYAPINSKSISKLFPYSFLISAGVPWPAILPPLVMIASREDSISASSIECVVRRIADERWPLKFHNSESKV